MKIKGLCKLYGHKWIYNFPIGSLPKAARCKRCKKKVEFDVKTLEWKVVA